MLKYSWKLEVKEGRMSYAGWCWKVHNNQADMGYSTRARQFPHTHWYYHSTILNEEMKTEMRGSEL